MHLRRISVSAYFKAISHYSCCTAVKEISYRQLKSIDMDALRADLTTSELCTNVFRDLDMMVSCYNSTLSSLLDKYAPLRIKSVANRKRVLGLTTKLTMLLRLGGELRGNGAILNLYRI